MGVLTDLIVAPRDEADAVAQATGAVRKWPSLETKGLGVEVLASLHCILDGVDPTAEAQPPALRTNPFTGAKTRLTTVQRYVDGFETCGDPGETEVWMGRSPVAFVERLAGLDDVALRDLGRAWAEDDAKQSRGKRAPLSLDEAVTCLKNIVALARTARERGHQLYVWMCP